MPDFKTLVSAAAALRAKSVSARELLQDILTRIDRDDRFIRAYSDLTPETAEAEAEASAARHAEGKPLSLLDGIPIGIKDLIDTTPARCGAGLPHLADYRPRRDAESVRRLREAGAVIIGVLETDAGAFGTRTPQVINPIAPHLIAGGSSGGAGAAVSAELAFGAIGTDTGGSIRIPAACCSVAGFKPTWGRVSTEGVRPLAYSCDHVGPLARSVADLQAIFSVLDPHCQSPEPEPIGALRIGVSPDYYGDADPLVMKAMAHVMSGLADARHGLHTVSMPPPDDVMDPHMITVTREAATYHMEQFPGLWQTHPDMARTGIELGRSFTEENYAAAKELRRHLTDAVDGLFHDVDILVLPTMPIDAPPRAAETVTLAGRELTVLEATIRYTALFNNTGHPVVSLPACSLPDGRALSVQIVGPRHGDQRLLAVARLLERSFNLTVDYAGLVAAARPDAQGLQRRFAFIHK